MNSSSQVSLARELQGDRCEASGGKEGTDDGSGTADARWRQLLKQEQGHALSRNADCRQCAASDEQISCRPEACTEPGMHMTTHRKPHMLRIATS